MNIKVRNIISAVLLALWVFIPANASASNVTVKASVDSVDMIMGDQTHIRVTVDVPAAYASTVELIDFPLLTPGLEYIPFHGIDVVASDSSAVRTDERTLYNFDFTVQAFDPGTVTIPPFSVVPSPGADTVRSGALALKVAPVDVDSLETIHPMASIVSANTRWYDYIPGWLLWIIVIGVVIAGGVFAYIMLRKRKEEAEEMKAAPVPPYELAISRLEQLRKSNLVETGQEKQYYTQLVDILRQYLEGRFGINAMEMTSTQIVRALRSNPETRMTADEVRAVLSVADFVKFAKVRPLPDDNVKAFRRAVNFVDITKPKPEPEEGSEVDATGQTTDKTKK